MTTRAKNNLVGCQHKWKKVSRKTLVCLICRKKLVFKYKQSFNNAFNAVELSNAITAMVKEATDKLLKTES